MELFGGQINESEVLSDGDAEVARHHENSARNDVCGPPTAGPGPIRPKGSLRSRALLLTESCQGICQRSTPKTCLLSCLPVSTMLARVRTSLHVFARTSVVVAAGIRIAVAQPFQLCRIMHLDRTHAPAREGSIDVFPRRPLPPSSSPQSCPLPSSIECALSNASI